MGIVRPKLRKLVDVSPSGLLKIFMPLKVLSYITHPPWFISSLCRAEGLATQEGQGLNDFEDPAVASKSFLTNKVVDPLHTFNEAGQPRLSESTDSIFVPRWQTFPVLKTSTVNENLLENSRMSKVVMASIESRSAVFSGFHYAPSGGPSDPNRTTAIFATLESMTTGEQVEYLGDPMTHFAVPIFDSVNGTERGQVVGVLLATLHWQHYLRDILGVADDGYDVVIENGCDVARENMFTYHIDGPVVKEVQRSDRHDRLYSQYVVAGSVSNDKVDDGTPEGIRYEDSCPYVFKVYPTEPLYNKYVTGLPILLCLSIATVFGVVIGMFIYFGSLVERRQAIILAKATQSTAIVSSMFVSPTNPIPLLCDRPNDTNRQRVFFVRVHSQRKSEIVC